MNLRDNSLSPTKPLPQDLTNPPSDPDPRAYQHSAQKSPNIRAKYNALSKNHNVSSPNINPQQRILSDIAQKNVFSPQKRAVRLFNSPQINHTSPGQYFSQKPELEQSKDAGFNAASRLPEIGGLSPQRQLSGFQNEPFYPRDIPATKRDHNKVYLSRTKND